MERVISELINKNYEGQTWDFKEFHHENKSSLLHDILCMANQLNNNERYIIIGVRDPKPRCQLVGVEETKRRNQNELMDFIQNLDFAGDNKPDVQLKIVTIENFTLDVIVIYPSDNVPFYLNSDYRDGNKTVRANYIYSRNGDRNTPINESCDMNTVEMLWKKRFGLDKSVLERFEYLLCDYAGWDIDVGNKKVAYHRTYPEFSIEFGNPEFFYEPFSGSYLNEMSYLGTLKLKYQSTIIYESEYWFVDEMRKHLAFATTGRIMSINEGFFWYYIKDDIDGKLLNLFTEGTYSLDSRFYGGSQFLVFDSHSQKEYFMSVLEEKPDLIEAYQPTLDAEQARKIQLERKMFLGMNPLIISKIKQCFEDSKNNFR